MASSSVAESDFAIRWPEPPALKFAETPAGAVPCEIEFRNGTKEGGQLLHFTGRQDYLIFRPQSLDGPTKGQVTVKLDKIKQVRLTRPMPVMGSSGTLTEIGETEVQVYNVEFTDGEITSGETSGYVRLPAGLFLYFQQPQSSIARVFVPEDAIAYCQIGDPIGKLLVEENVVSEEQLKVAVEKQQSMRKLVLGDYLIEQGYITQAQLDSALKFQKQNPNLRLGEALIEMGVLSAEALQDALERQRANRGRPLGQILVDMGALDSQTLKKVHAKHLGLPFVSLANARIDHDALKLVPAALAHRLGVLALAIEDGALIVAMSAQPDSETLAELSGHARMRILPVIASGPEIRAKQVEFYGEASLQDEPIADPSAIRFADSSIELDQSEPGLIETILAGERPHEIVDQINANSDAVLVGVVNRLLDAALKSGTLEVGVETSGSTRRTLIRFEKGGS